MSYELVTKEDIENRHRLVAADWKGLALKLLAERDAYREVAIQYVVINPGNERDVFIDDQAKKILERGQA